ncbi:hypothetical protein [Niabella ginsengisoli]|uniref:Uncharacterized protein n=1 Tax=Niabella ginsengisoli TaxID=522298 RepID=A0ABS9SP35_9BACT|nr:hypothetical protein [Niabella ginsengisoli]MCH5600129.1 hypothetical protein [Niabella ginsengisoli]
MMQVSIVFSFLLTAHLLSAQINNKTNGYLLTDRESYLSGDTVWAKVFFVDKNEPVAIAAYLTDCASNLIAGPYYFKVANNSSVIMLPLPQLQAKGLYNLLISSSGVINSPNIAKQIKIYGTGEVPLDCKDPDRIGFFPEGSHLIAGKVNRVVIKMEDDFSDTNNYSGQIFDKAGKTVCSFSLGYNGIGEVSITPEDDNGYYAMINGKNTCFLLQKLTRYYLR